MRDTDASLGYAQRQLVSFGRVNDQLNALAASRAYRYAVRLRRVLRALLRRR
jgi:hypothetical protein